MAFSGPLKVGEHSPQEVDTRAGVDNGTVTNGRILTNDLVLLEGEPPRVTRLYQA